MSEKTGLAEFARELIGLGVELYSTGGTRRSLEQAGLAVQDISAYTGFPEMMDGRLKTLHPKVHGGILCRHDHAEDMASLESQGILTFELVVVNLYPFEATVAKSGVTFDEAIEQIDIGGPSLVRGAAKNHAFTTIVTQAAQYARVLEQLRATGATTLELRRDLAAAAFSTTASYDAAISAWWQRQISTDTFPASVSVRLERQEVLRYGENPHQAAAVYAQAGKTDGRLIGAQQLNGKELSYNNLLDLHSALAIVRSLPKPAVSVIKHNNPCGAATHPDLDEATRRALQGDPVSAFGSVLAFNRPVDAASAEVLAEPGRFVEAIVAPAFDPEALIILTTKPKWRENVRLLSGVSAAPPSVPSELEYRAIDGGFLVQQADADADPERDWKTVTTLEVTPGFVSELRFAWTLARHVKSNAIVLANECSLVGVGAGQMSRVDSVEIAIKKAGPRARESVLASDAFFPFADSIDLAAAAGVWAIIQPGGSRKDDEVIAACNKHGIAMIFTGRRHFRH